MTDSPALTRRGKHRTGAGARWNADTITLYRAVNIGVVATAFAAVLISWQGLVYVAAWMKLDGYWTWLLPLAIDLPIVVFTLATLARKARGEGVIFLSVIAYGMTAISSFANFLHVTDAGPVTSLQVGVGASLAALAPILVLLTTEALGLIATKPPREQSPGRRAKVQAARIKELESAQRKQAKELKAAAEREEAAVTQLATAKRALGVLKPPALLSPETLNEVESALGTLPAPYATMSPAASYTGDIAHASSTTTGGNA